MKKSLLLIPIVSLSLIGCGSSKKKDDRELEEREHEKIQRDYVVKDASSNFKPGWIEDAEVWAKNHSKDTKRYRYFSYETEPKVSRSIACNLAKANAKTDIAGEISTFIDKQLATSQEGNASIDENNPEVQALREYTENTLAEKIQAMIHGAAVVKTYWEKRMYKQDLGAKKDYRAYSCAVFVRMDSKRLNTAVQNAANLLIKRVDDPSTKANVKKALKDASDNFAKARQGQI
jgi:hypothetical protein